MEENVLNVFLRPGRLQLEKRSLVLGKCIDIEKLKWFIKSQMPADFDVLYLHCDEYQSVIDLVTIVNAIKEITNKDIVMYVYNVGEIPDGIDFAWNRHCDDICYKMQSILR